MSRILADKLPFMFTIKKALQLTTFVPLSLKFKIIILITIICAKYLTQFSTKLLFCQVF